MVQVKYHDCVFKSKKLSVNLEIVASNKMKSHCAFTAACANQEKRSDAVAMMIFSVRLK